MNRTEVICGDACEELNKIQDKSIHCVITSPPYNVNLGNNKFKKVGYNTYDDNLTHDEYLMWMKDVFSECYRVLSEDGRICINIGDGRNGRVTTHSDFIQICKEIGFLPITTIVWNKNSISNRCAWGSYLSPSSPSFPCPFEYILIFGKTHSLIRKGVSTVTKEEWIECTNGIWTFSGEKKQKEIGHPAMFPVELPYRLIQMLTYENDVILDPFMGAGTTGVACIKTNRSFIGIDKDSGYCEIAKKRLDELKKTR